MELLPFHTCEAKAEFFVFGLFSSGT